MPAICALAISLFFAADFELKDLTRAPFRAVRVWAPPPGTPGPFDTLVLLHGNQGAIDDPTWMIGLRAQPGFERRILIVPALDDNDWGSAASAQAIGALLDSFGGRAVLVGYSAGASRVLALERRLPGRFAAIVAVAGDIARPIRDSRQSPKSLPRTLLVCMNDDPGPHTSCKLNQTNLELLQRRGAAKVSLRRLDGTHRLDLGALASLLDEWLRS